MPKISDLILAVCFLSFFLITDEKENRNIDNIEATIETTPFHALPVDSLDVYDSYADFTY